MSKKRINRKFTRTMQKKLAVLFVIILLALIGLNLRISLISAKSGDKYKKQVLSQQQYDSITLPYKRGDILDRNKTVLATSLKVYNLAIDCMSINEGTDKKYVEPTIRALVDYLNVDEDSLRELLTNDETSSLQYKVLRKEVSVEEKEAFEEFLNIPEDSEMSKEERDRRNNVRGVWFEEQYIRQYPNGSLASNLLGFSNSENMGNTGIEGSYNDDLNGTNGREYGYLNQDEG
ncbi:MAG TPA: cell division protein FtsI, partial [Candidatus Merdenecus merdavium]|nr:cell division protein FtsI [Candidatus Merdenecus merdavium]